MLFASPQAVFLNQGSLTEPQRQKNYLSNYFIFFFGGDNYFLSSLKDGTTSSCRWYLLDAQKGSESITLKGCLRDSRLPWLEKAEERQTDSVTALFTRKPSSRPRSVPILLKAVLTHSPTHGLLLEYAGSPDMAVGGDCCCFHRHHHQSSVVYSFYWFSTPGIYCVPTETCFFLFPGTQPGYLSQLPLQLDMTEFWSLDCRWK